MNKRTVGMLGLGSRSTLYYVHVLNKLFNENNGGYSTFPFLLLNADFDSINPLLPNTSKELDAIIEGYLRELEFMQIDHILVPNITLHETIDRLAIQKNVIHPVHLAIAKMQENQWTTIVLFGSLHTMESSYLRSYLNSNGIEVLLPSKEDRLTIDQIRKLTYNETETDAIVAGYHLLIEKYSANYPVVLACTELSIIKPHGNKNLLDMAQLQIEQALKCTH